MLIVISSDAIVTFKVYFPPLLEFLALLLQLQPPSSDLVPKRATLPDIYRVVQEVNYIAKGVPAIAL